MRTERSTRAALVGLAVVALASTATAQPGAAPGLAEIAVAPAATPPRAPHRLELALVGGLRVTAVDGAARRFVDDALDYGWRGAANRPLPGVRVEGRYLLTPLVDLGGGLAWYAADVARGFDDSDRLRLRLWEASVSARLHWAGGRPFVPEPRVDVGLGAARTTVHGVTEHTLHRYLRAGVDWRLGTRRAGVVLQVGYTLAHTPRLDGPSPARGGLDLSAGPYLRF